MKLYITTRDKLCRFTPDVDVRIPATVEVRSPLHEDIILNLISKERVKDVTIYKYEPIALGNYFRSELCVDESSEQRTSIKILERE